MNDKELKGKKLLILAGADVHSKVVSAAKQLGVYTIVTDYLSPEEAPAKQIADEYWMLDITDIDSIVEKCRKERVDGVLAFCIDPAQIPYQKICEKLGFPCYGTKKQFEILTNKRKFKDYCVANGVDIIPEYSINDVKTGKVTYPVLVKPSVSRGSRGQTVCYTCDEVFQALEIARRESGDGKILIERYMDDAQDMSFAYIVIDGEPYLTKIGDRYLGKIEDNLDRQHMATILPSSHTNEYRHDIEPKVINMIKALGLKFGAVFLQGFWENGRVYMYDPGLRFPGSDYDLVMRNTTGFDNMKSFVRFALTGDTSSCYGNPKDCCLLNGNKCFILSISAKAGTIGRLEGFESIAKKECVLSSSLRHHVGDEIPNSGDVKQRVAEFVVQLRDKKSIKAFLSEVYDQINILDENGNDMVISKVKL